MADLKISALTASTTPLAGTEVLPIVQSSTTKQVSVANLTAGRTVSGLNFISGSDTTNFNVVAGTTTTAPGISAYGKSTGAAPGWVVYTSGTADFVGTHAWYKNDFAGTATYLGGWYSNGDYKLNNGNVVIGTSGKGITTGSSIPLGFGVNGSTSQVTIDTSGNVLVNAASANAKFNTETTGNSVAGFFKNDTSGYQTVTVQNAGAAGTRYLIWFIAGTTDVGYITSNGTGVTYATLSDYRLKDSPQPMTGALDKIAQLKPCTYTWKSSGETGQGFIAHELQSVFPEAVAGEKDEVDANGKPVYQGVDTSFLVATLVAAVQELQAKVAVLEGK
jgi:hypothetical protein